MLCRPALLLAACAFAAWATPSNNKTAKIAWYRKLPDVTYAEAPVPGEPGAFLLAGTILYPSDTDPAMSGYVQKWFDGAKEATWTGKFAPPGIWAVGFNTMAIIPGGASIVVAGWSQPSGYSASQGGLVACFDAHTGDLLWGSVRAYPGGGDDTQWVGTAVLGTVADGRLVVVADASRESNTWVAWLDTQTGTEVSRARLPTGGKMMRLSETGGRLFVLDSEVEMYNVSEPVAVPKTTDDFVELPMLWSWGDGLGAVRPVSDDSAAALAGGCVLVGCDVCKLGAALLTCEGKLVWQTPSIMSVDFTESPHGGDVVAVSGIYNHNIADKTTWRSLITLLSSSSGKVLWSTDFPDDVNGLDGVSFDPDDSSALYAAVTDSAGMDWDEVLFRLNANSGEIIWSTHANNAAFGAGPFVVAQPSGDPHIIGFGGMSIFSAHQSD